MKILAIGAHFDDIELGCGGTLYKHYTRGDEIFYLIITKSDYKSSINKHTRTSSQAKKEGYKSAKLLEANIIEGNFETLTLQPNKELINFLCEKISYIKPDVVYTHFKGDQHMDHRAVAQASIIATRNVDSVFAYMSNIYDTEPLFNPNKFVDISKYFKTKQKMINFFKSEKETHNWVKQLILFNGLYGFKNGVEYCEPFYIIKQIDR